MPTYILADKVWKEFTEDGFIGIPAYGCVIFRKPGWKNILYNPESPKLINVEDSEMYRLVSMLRGEPE